MSKDRFRPIPQNAGQWHDSFAASPGDALINRTLTDHYAREDALRRLVVGSLSPQFYQSIVEESKARPLTSDEARKMVTTEAAALMLNFPQLLTATPNFPYLYRLLRMLELTKGLKRGGNTLFVASGTTIPEVMANFILPPSFSMVEKVFQTDSPVAFVEVGEGYLGKLKKKLDFAKPTQLLEGHATAIEPDPEVMLKLGEQNEEIGMPMEVLTFIPLDIAKAMQTGQVPSNLDTVIWHRAEPKIFFEKRGGKDAKQARRNIRSILSPLLKNLSSSGHFLFTVGRGYNIFELKDRVFLLTELHSVLPDLNHQPIYANRDFRLTDDVTLFGTSFGSFGAVASTTQARISDR